MSIGLSGLLFEWPFKTGLTVYRNHTLEIKTTSQNWARKIFLIHIFRLFYSFFTLRLLVSKQNFAKRLILNADQARLNV